MTEKYAAFDLARILGACDHNELRLVDHDGGFAVHADLPQECNLNPGAAMDRKNQRLHREASFPPSDGSAAGE